MSETRDFSLFELFGYRLEIHWSVLPASFAMWVGYGLVYHYLMNYSDSKSILAGLVSVGLHWGVVLYHHYGHFKVAYDLTYPMHHVVVRGVGASGVYLGEQDAPPETHIRRALGGIFHSLGLSLTLAGITLFLFLFFTGVWWVMALAWAECLFIYTIGMSLPLERFGIRTDGGEIVKWRRVLLGKAPYPTSQSLESKS